MHPPSLQQHRALLGLIALLLPMCSPEEEPIENTTLEEPPEPPRLIVDERFAYPAGPLAGNATPPGLAGTWLDRKGRWIDGNHPTQVAGGIASQAPVPNRCYCLFDTTPAGPFADYLDEQGNLGKDGTTLYLSFYQEIVNGDTDRATVAEIMRGEGLPELTTQFNIGCDTDPGPGGPFGLRVQRKRELSIPAPEFHNDRENLIVLRVQFGEADRDTVTFYYNPGIADEEKPEDGINAENLSFDRFGFGSFHNSGQKIRHLRVGRDFASVALDE